METLDRFTGCMLGGASGDALGYLIEFDDLHTIRRKYGAYGLRTILKSKVNGNQGLISDDTQMSLFTADGLLWAAQAGLEPQEGVFRSYMRWYYTQTERIVSPEQMAWMKRQEHEIQWSYDLMGIQSLYARRAPGKTCLMTLATGRRFTETNLPNARCGSSAVMRVAPVGLFFSGDWERAFAVGAQTACLTHGDLTARLAAGALSLLIAQLSSGAALAPSLESMMQVVKRQKGSEALLAVLDKAFVEAASEHGAVQAMKEIGTGNTAREVLALAIYCILKADSLKNAVIMACNQDGASDSCGAVCGNIGGALYGATAVPKNWSNNLECRGIVEQLGDCLYQYGRGGKKSNAS